MTTHYFDEPNKEWLDLRKKYLTATETASLFQLGNMSIAAVAQNKIEQQEIVKNEFMIIGNILEPAVLSSFKWRLGMNAQPASPDKIVMITNDELRLSATPDGKYKDECGDWHLIECKTTGSANTTKAIANFNKWSEGVPNHYALQVHTQMIVTNLQSAYIGCILYQYPLPFIVYRILYSKEIQDLIKSETLRFWDCFDNNKIFKSNKSYKDSILELLKEHQELVYISHNMKEV